VPSSLAVRTRESRWFAGWRKYVVALFAIVAAVAFTPATTAQAAGAVRISDDPFTAPTGQHATEVEPDTFAFGSTMVATFQVGRVFDGGANDIGWATTNDGGKTWTHGFLPATSVDATPPGPFFAVSDASVAFDAEHGVWIISWLGLHEQGGGEVDVMVSRSTDDGRTWSDPVQVAATGTFYDKNWTACDNTPSSPFFGNCYTEFDDAGQGDLELMSTSTDGGLTWGAPKPTADRARGLGGQPVVQPDGRVVVPFLGISGNDSIRSFTSDDGGETWNASALVSEISEHEVAGELRTEALPSAEVSGDGEVYVVWQDSRFEPGGTANDIVLSTSTDGTSWSGVGRIPLDPVGSNVDHFIPGIAVSTDTAGARTALALTYYFYPDAGCTADTCELTVGFTSSTNGGASWKKPKTLAGPMGLDQIAETSQGVMVGDYISTSFLAGGRRALPAFAVGMPPSNGQTFEEPTFSVVENANGGNVRMVDDPVRFSGTRAARTAAPPTAN
jgi:BNR repeat protein